MGGPNFSGPKFPPRSSFCPCDAYVCVRVFSILPCLIFLVPGGGGVLKCPGKRIRERKTHKHKQVWEAVLELDGWQK